MAFEQLLRKHGWIEWGAQVRRMRLALGGSFLPELARVGSVAPSCVLAKLQCPLLAQSGHGDRLNQCPLSGVKRTFVGSTSQVSG